MRIEKVEGNRQIKVLLTQNDLIEMNINIKTLTSDSPELHSFLFKVMDFIKEETGFNPKHGQVVVEASPADGGVILTVTKIKTAKEKVSPKPQNVRVKRKNTAERVYRFYSFDALTNYLTLSNNSFLETLRLFKLEDSFYAVAKDADLKLSEFSQLLPAIGTNSLFLSEHGSLVAEGDQLLKMAEKVKNLK